VKVILAFTVILSLIAGCASTGTSQPPSFPNLLQAARSVDDSLITVGDQLLQAKVISPAQAKKLLDIADQGWAALNAADVVFQAGNSALALTQLNATSGQLSLAQSCMNAANAGLTLDACLTGAPK
jgi:hypothetical protein